MTILTQVRSYTDATLQQSRSTLAGASDRLLSLPNGTKGLAAGAAMAARRQAFAALGASDAVLASITKRGEAAPSDAKQTAGRFLDSTLTLLAQAREVASRTQQQLASAADELTQRGTGAAQAARSIDLVAAGDSVRDELDTIVAQLKDALDKLAERGEQIATDLRHDPIVARLISDADTGVELAANRVTSAAQKLRARTAAQAEREAAGTTSTPVRPTPAAKVPSHKTTVRNTPAGEASVATNPTHRAAAEENATRKDAARKAAATRKAATEKAAVTRKGKAETREQAAEARKAASVKAAATRKRTAAKAARPAPATQSGTPASAAASTAAR